MTELVLRAWRIANNPAQVQWVLPMLWLADVVICAGIILKVPYTEIDWKAYMQQVDIYKAGERDYVKIYGDTGPLVYPGGHVYIYRLLHSVTDSGANIALAQWIFAVLYLLGLFVVMKCYKEARVAPIILPLLILSKRLHSIFLLRLFNDGFAVVFFFIAVYAYQKRMWTAGSVVWSIGLATKMSVLLALPAVGIIIWHGVGRDRAFKQAALMAQVQVMAGYEFLGANPYSYMSRAFEFSRQFLFKWTVNWRFVGEEVFLSKAFSRGLLIVHGVLVAVFIATRWIRPAGISLAGLEKALLFPPPPAEQDRISRRVKPGFIAFTMLSSIIIGCLCARSLHYQFYAYIAWSSPLLLWQSGLHPILIYAIWLAQEWAWNVYPSTDISSGIAVGCLAVTLTATWIGTSRSWVVNADEEDKKSL